MIDGCLKHVICEAYATGLHFRRLSLPALSILLEEPAFDFPQFQAIHALGRQLTSEAATRSILLSRKDRCRRFFSAIEGVTLNGRIPRTGAAL